MTRKDELEERVEQLASRFERIGESQAKYEIVEALLQVEREVWEKAIAILDGGRFLAETSLERTWAHAVITVMRQQQERS